MNLKGVYREGKNACFEFTLHGFSFQVCEEGISQYLHGENGGLKERFGGEIHAEGSKSILPPSFLILYNIRN
jgi:hypothetical protein